MIGFGSILKDYLKYYKISQTDFANRLNITQKHLNEILNKDADISLELMIAISLITDIDVNTILFAETKKNLYKDLNNKFKSVEEINTFLNSFCIKEMNEAKWIKLKDKTSYVQNAMDLLEFLNLRNFDMFDNYFDSRILYKKKSDADKKKLYLWITRCDMLSRKEKVSEYNKDNLSKLLDELKNERMKKFDEASIIKIFNKYGIYLIIEDALKGTKVRGCMMVKDKNPAIYMTRYLKEKSSFYYTLYHEISHIKTNYNQAKAKIMISDEYDEEKADNYALNKMIDENVWNDILKNIDNRETICLNNKIPLCFMYSRLAKEGYIKYNDKNLLKNKKSLYKL